jgi:uncharacterized protein (DUF1015 family)
MKGASEYAMLFSTGQYGKLYITSGHHARGTTFRIQILPEGEEAKYNGSVNTCLNSNAVEVYGIISGNAGWTEEYGWIHKGKWQEDFEKLVLFRKEEIKIKQEKEKFSIMQRRALEKERKSDLLKKY